MRPTRIRSLLTVSLSSLLIIVFSACLKNTPVLPPSQLPSIYATLSTSNGYSILSAAILKAGLKDSLMQGKGPFTLFAPSDLAFAFYGVNSVSDLTKISADSVKKIISYHIVNALLVSQSFPKGPDSSILTLAGYPAYLTAGSRYIYINGNIVNPPGNYFCSNGLIQPINGILNPPAATVSSTVPHIQNLRFFNAAIIRANLVTLLNGTMPYTVFAPSDSVFIAAGYKTVNDINNADQTALAKLLKYHIVNGHLFSADLIDNSSLSALQGGSLKVGNKNSISLTGTSNTSPAIAVNLNIAATNGVIYIINKILTP